MLVLSMPSTGLGLEVRVPQAGVLMLCTRMHHAQAGNADACCSMAGESIGGHGCLAHAQVHRQASGRQASTISMSVLGCT